MSSEAISADINESKIIDRHSHRNDALSKSRLFIVFLFTVFFMIVEFVTGYIANSLALIADAGHMLNDVASILFSIFAINLSSKKSTNKLTFGYKRVEVLSGLINGLSLLAISAYILKEAIIRYGSIDELKVKGSIVIIVGIIGLIVNIIGLYLISPAKEDSINVEGAYHHILADALGSIAALIAGVAIILFEAYWMDLVASLIVASLIVKSGLSLTTRSIKIIIQASPEGIDIDKLKEQLDSIDGVISINDLHAWRVTDGFDVLTAHIIIQNVDLTDKIRKEAIRITKKYGFNHVTLQVECIPCDACNDQDPTINETIIADH